MNLRDITMEDFKEGLEVTRTVIIPYGTVEEHGTHLPLSTDTLVVNEVVKRVAEEVKVFIAPPIHYGVCTSTSQHPGTLGISPATLRRITVDIVKGARAKGLRGFILISGHAGGLHLAAMREAGESLVGELEDIGMAVISIYGLVQRDAISIAETENDSHAGELETSLVLYLAGGLVKGRSKKEYPELPKPFIVRDKIKHWPGGVWGDPEAASVDKGRMLFRIMVDKVVGVVRDMENLRLTDS